MDLAFHVLAFLVGLAAGVLATCWRLRGAAGARLSTFGGNLATVLRAGGTGEER